MITFSVQLEHLFMAGLFAYFQEDKWLLDQYISALREVHFCIASYRLKRYAFI